MAAAGRHSDDARRRRAVQPGRTRRGTARRDSALDIGQTTVWIAGLVCWGAAAISPSAAAIVRPMTSMPRATPPPRRSALLAIAAIAPAVAVALTERHRPARRGRGHRRVRHGDRAAAGGPAQPRARPGRRPAARRADPRRRRRPARRGERHAGDPRHRAGRRDRARRARHAADRRRRRGRGRRTAHPRQRPRARGPAGPVRADARARGRAGRRARTRSSGSTRASARDPHATLGTPPREAGAPPRSPSASPRARSGSANGSGSCASSRPRPRWRSAGSA